MSISVATFLAAVMGPAAVAAAGLECKGFQAIGQGGLAGNIPYAEMAQALSAGTPQNSIASHATGGTVDRTRPLCPFGQVAKWNGTGSTDQAANFACVAESMAPRGR